MIICIFLFVWEILELSIVTELQSKQCPLMIVLFFIFHAYVLGFNQKYILFHAIGYKTLPFKLVIARIPVSNLAINAFIIVQITPKAKIKDW